MKDSRLGIAAAVVGMLLLAGCVPGPLLTTMVVPPADPDPGTALLAPTPVAGGTPTTLRAGHGWRIVAARLSAAGYPDVAAVPSGRSAKTGPLVPDTTYSVTAQMVSETSGRQTTVSRQLRTGPAAQTISAQFYPDSGTYGVGIIPTVTFDYDVPSQLRAELVKRLHVSSTVPVGGRWRWLDERTVAFRPRGFWPGHTRVNVAADLAGWSLPSSDGDQIWGVRRYAATFATDRALIVNVNAQTHSAEVTVDGKQVRTMGVSTGRDGFITRSGVKTLTDAYESKRMTNAGVTDEVYDLNVPYAIRLTDSGEFIHGAPWNPNIGSDNTSHGCTNLALDDSRWLFDNARWADPVVTSGTDRSMESWNGPGGLWNISFDEWTQT